jgi:hypothetical protein
MLNMIIRNSIYLLLILVITSCGSKTFDSTDELLEYISNEDNNYKYSKSVNGVEYVLQYRPTDLLVQQELGDENKDKNEIEKLRKKYSKFLYFNLSMSMNNKELLSNVVSDKEQFGQMVNDLAFNMDDKVHVFTPQKDTLAMTDFVYPRMYGMTNSTTILIVYPRDKEFLKEEYLNFTIEDLGLYTGEVKFKVQIKPLENEPKLNL